MAAYVQFEAIGTTWKIDASKDVLGVIKECIAEFDKAYSRFRPDSLVSEMARNAGTHPIEYQLPDDAKPMMQLYREMYDLTGGLMTPLVGQVLVDAGYDANYSLEPKQSIPKAPAWDDVMSYDAARNVLTMKKTAILDFGAIGKGYLIDIVAGLLRANGVTEYTVDAGGDIAHMSATGSALRIGLEDPSDATKALGVVEVKNQSVCGSAGNRRAWDRFHHIINPEKVESPRHIAGLWTVAETTMLADALSTALFFVGPEKLVAKYKFEFAIVFADRSAVVSKGFPGSLFTA
jgi:thiamine biosynthesis lipoprotein